MGINIRTVGCILYLSDIFFCYVTFYFFLLRNVLFPDLKSVHYSTMKRELPQDAPTPKRAKIMTRVKLEYDPKLNESLCDTKSLDCFKITRNSQSEANKTGVIQFSKLDEYTQTCMRVYMKKSSMDAKLVTKHNVIGLSRAHTSERHKQLVFDMFSLKTAQDLEDNLIHQMNALSDECQQSVELINQIRLDGKEKLKLWRQMYLQLKAGRQ